MPKAKGSTQIQLVYDGPDVKDGTIKVEDMVDALIGFGRAYSKVAGVHNISEHHNLRVSGIRKNSADIIITIVPGGVSELLVPAAVIAGNVATMIGSIVAVIKLTRHMEGAKKPRSVPITNHGNMQVINANNVSMEVSKRDYELYQSEILRPDLDHLTRPLDAGRVDLVELRDVKGNKVEGSQITASERDWFRSESQRVTTTKDDVKIDGYMKSLNKDSNSGSFYLENGERVKYKLAGKRPELLWGGFVERGPVRVRCRASFDESLKLTLLEIYSIQPIQKDLFKKK